MYIITSSWAQCCQHSSQPTRKLQAGFLCCPNIQNINVEQMICNNNCDTILNKFQANAPVTDLTLQVCALDRPSACSPRCRTWRCRRSAERWSGRWSGWSRRGCRSALLPRGGTRRSPGSHLEQIIERMECGRAWLEEEDCWTYKRKIEIGNPGSALRFTISWVDVVGCQKISVKNCINKSSSWIMMYNCQIMWENQTISPEQSNRFGMDVPILLI